VKRLSIFLIAVVLIAGMVGCDNGGYNPPPSQNLEIRDWYDLDQVRYNLAGKHTLMNDLDSATAGYTELASPTANQGKGWDPIGWFYTAPFTGSLDGQGYEIRDLSINRPHECQVALFAFVGEAGAIQNVSVVNATVTGGGPVGSLVAMNDGTVSNSYSTGNVTGDGEVGGLVGHNGGIVNNSYSSGSVTGDYSSSNVPGEGWCVGGLVAMNDGTVSNSYSTGNVNGNLYVGGLVGRSYYGTVSNSYSTGSVTGDSSVGGLVGWNEGGTVSASFWDTETSGQATSDGGTGKTTAEMQDIATFSAAGWNIIAVAPGSTNTTYTWNIVNGVTYPFLSWQP